MVDLAFNEKLTNPNIMIVGETGSGKTTTIRTILHALVQQNVPFFVLDLEDSFVDYADVKIDIKNSASKSINPLEIDSETVTPYDNAQQIRDIIASIFPELGDWQKSFLLNAIMDSYVKAGFIRNKAGQHTRKVPSFNAILENLIARQEDASPAEKRQIEGIKVRLDPVFEYDIFSKPHTLSFTEVSKKRVAVLLRNLLSDELKALVISFFLKKIFNFYQMQPEVESGQIRSFVVIDETHRLSTEEGAPLEVGLRQLRKRGVGFVLASQFPRDFERNPAISGNIETRIAHKCEDDHAKAAAALVSTKAEMSPNLTREILSLNKGEAILRHKNDQGGTSTERIRIVFKAPV
jgi:DNA helicase HerA-like ATPase